MRFFLPLVITLLYTVSLFGQNEEALVCKEIDKLLNEGKYKSAYKLLVIEGEYSCGQHKYAEVLRWNERYEDALALLSSETESELKKEIEDHLGIRPKKELYKIRSFDGNDSLSRVIFAFDESPIFVSTSQVQTSFFPVKEYETAVAFSSKNDSAEFYSLFSKEFYKRQEKLNFELNGAWNHKDSILYYSAYYKVPFSSKGFHSDYAIYQWKGKKHKLLNRLNKNEMAIHPTVTNDGWLIFSSDRAGGFGGMDLWKINLAAQEAEPINLGEAINSAFDEIYPAEAGDSLYYATNDPARSLGGFDIMLFANGKSTNPEKPLNSVNNETNPYTVNGDLSFIITDRLYPDSLNLVYTVTPFKRRLLFDLLRGEVENDLVVAGDKVELLDGEGNLLDYTYVNSSGRFTFVNIKGLENYSISFGKKKLNEGDVVRLLDKNYQLMDQFIADENGQVKFELLAPEDYSLRKEANKDDSVLSADILGMLMNNEKDGSSRPLEIILQDSQGSTLARVYTDESGQFLFEQVKPNDSYSFQAATIDLDSEIRIFNQDGQIIETIKPNEVGDLQYVRLKENDKTIIFSNEEEIALQADQTERANFPDLKFRFDDITVAKESQAVLSSLVALLKKNPRTNIELFGYTDSRGSTEYNLTLSSQRVMTVKDYLIAAGIEQNRITGKGFGESNLINDCGDGETCSEQKHAQNRRIEIIFSESEKQ